MGTGGTISGVGRYLKEQNPGIRIVGVDPVGSCSGNGSGSPPDEVQAKTYKVEGIGKTFTFHARFIGHR
jgi:cystathionine beta-synthase